MSDQLVILKTFDNYFTANICLTKLHAAGVEAYLRDEYTVTMDPILTNAIGGIKLVAKNEDEAAAKILLEQFDETYRKNATCPQCSANAFSYIAKPGVTNWLTAIFTWMFSSYAIAPDYVYQCGNCGYETATLPESSIETD
ncbi:MAG: hypothetical protein ACOYKE_13750 [Ferruginibacter sp.]